MKVVFPSKAGGLPRRSMFDRYYNTYYRFVLNTLLAAGGEIEVYGETSVGDGRFAIELNGATVIIDYSDHLTLADRHQEFSHYFKFHYVPEFHRMYSHVYPFSPVSFYDWNQYATMARSINYTADGDLISARQKPHGNALKRRTAVQKQLRKIPGLDVHTRPVDQQLFWAEAGKCLVSVCVPGFRNDILDRGQWQYMALGACTISSPISTMVAGFEPIVPGRHYIACNPDFSDLEQRLKWCADNREACVEIGRNAQKLFQSNCTPEALWSWVNKCIHEGANQHIDTHV